MPVFLEAGKEVNGHTVEKSLGGGGEGHAYLARTKEGTRVVLKQLAISATSRDDKAERERFHRLKRLFGLKHECVAKTIETFNHDAALYLVSEYVDGRPLRAFLESGTKFSVREAGQIAHNTLDGLAWLHAHDVIHRDIKPENLIVKRGSKGNLKTKIIDLGAALHMGLSRVTVRGVVGTPAYMAPELWSGPSGAISPAVDQFAVGVVTYEILTGRHPFAADTPTGFFVKVLHGDYPPLGTAVRGAPAELEAWIARLLLPNPSDRYPSADDALRALESALRGVFPTEARHTAPASAADARRAHREKADAVSAKAEASIIPKDKEPAARMVPVLKIMQGPLLDTCIVVPPTGLCLGRSVVNPEDRKISRFHCRVEPGRKTLVVTDLGTLNRLICRDERHRKLRLAPGDELTLGETSLMFSLEKETT